MIKENIMNYCTKEGVGSARNKIWTLLIYLFLIGTTSIHSQNLSSTEKTEITYNKLNEFAKFVVFKDSASAIFKKYRVELDKQNQIIQIKELKIKKYKDVIVPNYKKQLSKKDSIVLNNGYLMEISETKLKSQKSKKWTWLSVGAGVGFVLALLIGNQDKKSLNCGSSYIVVNIRGFKFIKRSSLIRGSFLFIRFILRGLIF